MKVVLDANSALAIALHKDEAEPYLQVVDEASEVLAPDLIVPEFVNGLWKLYQFSSLNPDVCDRAMDVLVQVVDTLVPSIQLCREAFSLGRSHKSKAAYDMFYLALTLREDAILLTLDKALKKEAKVLGVRVA